MPFESTFPYEGDKPYIFISYSHQDMDRVLPILKRLSSDGFRIWYDEGIDPGTEWPESIARHLSGSSVCMAFISQNSISSSNCRREINYALSKKLGFLWVKIDPCEMSPGMELQLSSFQALMSYTYPSFDQFYAKLTSLDILRPCREAQERGTSVQKPEKAAESSGQHRTHETGMNFPTKKRAGFIIGLAVLAVLLLIFGISKLKRPDLSEKIGNVATASVPEPSPVSLIPEGLSWSLEGGVLTIRGSGPMDDYGKDAIAAPWNNERENIISVVIEPGVTSISDFAFQYCTNLQQVSIPSSVEHIGTMAFNLCSSLTEIELPEGVVSLGDYVFWNCYYLSEVSFPSTVSYIGDSPFTACPSLSNITVSDGNTAYTSSGGVLYSKDQTYLICYPAQKQGTAYSIPDSVRGIGFAAFNYASILNTVTLPEGLKTVGDSAFESCYNLRFVFIPDNVTSIGVKAFKSCPKLSEINVSTDNPAYSSIDGILYNKAQTTLVSFPGAKRGAFEIPDSVTFIMDYAVSSCESITAVTLPESLTEIGSYAFSGCISLTDVFYPGTEAQWKTVLIGYGNDSLESSTIHLP